MRRSLNACLSVLPLVLVAVGCTAGSASPSVARSASTNATVPWGGVLGHITDSNSGGPMNLANRSDVVACDLGAIGFRSVRIEVQQGESAASYVSFLRAAKAHHVSVMILRQPAPFTCATGDQPCIEAWANAYVNDLNAIVDATHADAYEIGNEPNGEYAISPQGFASLVSHVWTGVKKTHPAITIVSGGVLNTYLNQEPFLNAFIDALPAERPFDAFGIHPYDPYSFTDANDTGPWIASVTAGLGAIQAKLTAKFGPTPLWATEVGFASARGPTNVAGSESAQALTFWAADQALSGLVDRAFWYDYRDDEPLAAGSQGFTFGLRASSLGAYRTKAIYGVIAASLGGRGESAACYGGSAAPPTAPPAASCGSLASQRGWQAPLCDNGNGICEGTGEATGDCGHCCDAPMVHCGSLQRVFNWGASATCDTGAGECAGNATAQRTQDCAGGCCSR